MTRVTSQALNNSYERDTFSDGFGKQAEMMRTGRGAAGRSRWGQGRQEKFSRRYIFDSRDRQWCDFVTWLIGTGRKFQHRMSRLYRAFKMYDAVDKLNLW